MDKVFDSKLNACEIKSNNSHGCFSELGQLFSVLPFCLHCNMFVISQGSHVVCTSFVSQSHYYVSISVSTASAVAAIPLPRLPCPTSATVAPDVDTDIVFRYILFINICVCNAQCTPTDWQSAVGDIANCRLTIGVSR